MPTNLTTTRGIPPLQIGGTPTVEGMFVSCFGINALYQVNQGKGQLLCNDMGVTLRYWLSNPNTAVPDVMIAYDDDTLMMWVAGTTNNWENFWRSFGSLAPVPTPDGRYPGLENPAFQRWGAEIYTYLRPYLQTRKWKNIQLTGHSMGFVAVTAMAERMEAEFRNHAIVDLLGFGAPKLWIQGSILPQWRSYIRVESEADPIPKVPISFVIGFGTGKLFSAIKATLTAMHFTESTPSLSWVQMGRAFVIDNRGHIRPDDRNRNLAAIEDATGVGLLANIPWHSMNDIYLPYVENMYPNMLLPSKYRDLQIYILRQITPSNFNVVAQPRTQGVSMVSLHDLKISLLNFVQNRSSYGSAGFSTHSQLSGRWLGGNASNREFTPEETSALQQIIYQASNANDVTRGLRVAVQAGTISAFVQGRVDYELSKILIFAPGGTASQIPQQVFPLPVPQQVVDIVLPPAPFNPNKPDLGRGQLPLITPLTPDEAGDVRINRLLQDDPNSLVTNPWIDFSEPPVQDDENPPNPSSPVAQPAITISAQSLVNGLVTYDSIRYLRPVVVPLSAEQWGVMISGHNVLTYGDRGDAVRAGQNCWQAIRGFVGDNLSHDDFTQAVEGYIAVLQGLTANE